MKIISNTSFFIAQGLGKQKYDSNTTYRSLKFIITAEVEDGVLLFNQLTLQLVLLSKQEYNNFKGKNNDELFCFFVENWYYVPNDFNEIEVHYQIRNLARTFNYGMNYRQYTIFPTLDCNARCFYCFENGKNRDSMTIETAQKLSEFIIKNDIKTENNLRWFGGEPLCNIPVIDTICSNLRENNVAFNSDFVSNAYLFNNDNIKKAKDEWNINSVHTTLDGTQDIYNNIKKYIYKEDNNPFITVINNIHNLLNNGIMVMVRMNVSQTNADDIEKLIDFLVEEFKGEKLFSMYVSLLHKANLTGWSANDDKQLEIQAESLIRFSKKIFESGFNKFTIPTDISANLCKADSDSSFVVLPNGNFTKCENFVEENRLGNVFGATADKNLVNEWKEFAPLLDTCQNCALVPNCVMLKNCDHGTRNSCKAPIKKIHIQTIKTNMKQTYRNFLEKENNS